MPWVPNDYDDNLPKAFPAYMELNKAEAIDIVRKLTAAWEQSVTSFAVTSIAKGQKRKIWLSASSYHRVLHYKGAEWAKSNIKFVEDL